MKTRQRKVFERVVNPLIVKHLVTTPDYNGTCIASYQLNICLTLKEVSGQKNAKKIRYRYRVQVCMKTQYKTEIKNALY